MTPTPIKRSKNLVALSKDHHEGLLVVWKIRQGQRYQVESKRIADFVLHAFDSHLEPHFKDEEELLFTHLPANDELLIKAKEQHAFIRQQVEELRYTVSAEQLSTLGNALEEHIRFEERILFQHLEKQLTVDELETIGAALEVSHLNLKPIYWEDEFWLRK